MSVFNGSLVFMCVMCCLINSCTLSEQPCHYYQAVPSNDASPNNVDAFADHLKTIVLPEISYYENSTVEIIETLSERINQTLSEHDLFGISIILHPSPDGHNQKSNRDTRWTFSLASLPIYDSMLSAARHMGMDIKYENGIFFLFPLPIEESYNDNPLAKISSLMFPDFMIITNGAPLGEFCKVLTEFYESDRRSSNRLEFVFMCDPALAERNAVRPYPLITPDTLIDAHPVRDIPLADYIEKICGAFDVSIVEKDGDIWFVDAKLTEE